MTFCGIMRALIRDAGLSKTWLKNTLDMLGRISYVVDGEKPLEGIRNGKLEHTAMGCMCLVCSIRSRG